MDTKNNSQVVVLLVNTGTPEDTKVRTVRKYLREFLMDKHVIGLPFFFRFLIVNGIIAPFRAPHSAKKYATIFENGVSPLYKHTKELAEKLNDVCNVPVEFGMRYGKPTAKETVKQILSKYKNVKKVVVMPLFPQKTQSSFTTAFLHFNKHFLKQNPKLEIECANPFYNNNIYINTLTHHIKTQITDNYDKLIFSFHGIPLSHEVNFHTNHADFENGINCGCLENDDKICYHYQCYYTAQKLAEKLGLQPDKWELTFQSRLGHTKWHTPATAQRLKELPRENCKNIAIVTPSFVADCLETLEEINIEGREIFTKAGGKNFQYIPTLNTEKEWITALKEIIEKEINHKSISKD